MKIAMATQQIAITKVNTIATISTIILTPAAATAAVPPAAAATATAPPAIAAFSSSVSPSSSSSPSSLNDTQTYVGSVLESGLNFIGDDSSL